MNVDIIDLEEENFRNLNTLQLAMVYAAQTQKDQIVAAAEAKKTNYLNTLLKHNMSRSTILEDVVAEVDAATETQIAAVKEDLLYRLAYSDRFGDGNEFGPYHYPENPNYKLTYEQRFLVVRDYYMHLNVNAQTRLSLFGLDTLAADYLGYYYQTLYELLKSYTK